MSDSVETIKVKADNDQGFIVINKSDMSKDDVLFSDKAPAKNTSKKVDKKSK